MGTSWVISALDIIAFMYGIFLFIYFICNFFQSFNIIPYTQKVAAHYKEQNKKRIMTIGSKNIKLFKVKKCQKNGPKPQKFSLKNT